MDDGSIMSGDTAIDYFAGHDLIYACNTDFDTSKASLVCTCTATANPINIDPAWDCGGGMANFPSNTCRRSKKKNLLTDPKNVA